MINYASAHAPDLPTAAEAVKYLDWMRGRGFVDFGAHVDGWMASFGDDDVLLSVNGDDFAEVVLRLYLAVRDAGL